MYSKIFISSIRYSFIPFSKLFIKDPDDVPIAQLKLDSNEIPKETGWDRVKRMYSIDEFGNITPEANSITQVGMLSLFAGCIYGGIYGSKDAYNDFITNNTASTFKNHFDAKKKMQDYMTISFAKGAFKWSWRLTLFSMSFMAFTTTIQVYRNKFGILEHAIGGGIAGAMYRFNHGPKGWVSGGLVGCGLGMICGALTVGLLKMAGVSMEEAHLWRYKIREMRSGMKKKQFEKHFEDEDFAIVKLHNLDIGEAGHTLDALDKQNNVKKDENVVNTKINN